MSDGGKGEVLRQSGSGDTAEIEVGQTNHEVPTQVVRMLIEISQQTRTSYKRSKMGSEVLSKNRRNKQRKARWRHERLMADLDRESYEPKTANPKPSNENKEELSRSAG